MFFLKLKMLISRKPVTLEQQMSSFGKKRFPLIRTFIHGYCEVLNMKVNIWLDIPRKYLKDSCVIVSAAVGIFSQKLTDICCQDFSLWCFWHFSGYS